MKWPAKILLPAIVVILQGCYASSLVEFDILKPADITFPPDIRSLAVIDRCDLDSTLRAESVKSGNIRQFKRDSLFSKQMVVGCSDAMVEAPRFSLINPVLKRMLDGDYRDPAVKIPWAAIRQVAGDTLADAVLSLEYAYVDDTIRFHDDDWLGYYQYSVFIKSTWRMYRLSDFQSKEFQFRDTTVFDIPSPSEFQASSENVLNCIKDAMYDAGVRTARRLSPWWDGVQRYCFAVGPMDFLTGGQYMRDGKWQEAAEVWQRYTGSKRKSVAAKACFNMAVTSEMGGNIEAAVEWLKKAENLGVHEFYVNDYQPKLIKRKAETETLDAQMK